MIRREIIQYNSNISKKCTTVDENYNYHQILKVFVIYHYGHLEIIHLLLLYNDCLTGLQNEHDHEISA